MIMLNSIAARSSWQSPVITVKQATETTSATLRVKKKRACSDILSDALSGKSRQSLRPSFVVLSFRAIFMFQWIRLSFTKKKLALNSLFSILSCEKIRVFLRAIIWLKFIEHFTSRFCIRDLKTSSESVKFDLPNYLVCKLSQIVNIDGFLTLMFWHFWQLLSCSANPIIWTILTGILIGLL